MQLADRFWPRVNREGACWEWIGGRIPQGYGAVWLDGRNRPAHRIAWELVNGPIPDGLFVLHHCDNPPCVNPAHLWLGTQADNMADKARKGRAASGLRNGVHLGRQMILSGDEVRQIRSLAAEGMPRRELMHRFRISQSHVSRIVNRRVWRAI